MYIEILVLRQLESGPKHGYEIKKNIQNLHGNDLSVNNNVLYPILKRFEDMGAVQKKIEQQEGKPNRNIYTITSIGSELLSDILEDFPEVIASNKNEFLIRVSLFGLLTVQTRKRILLTRKIVLEKNLARFEHIAEITAKKQMPFADKVVEFQKAHIKLELQWISELEKEIMKRPEPG